MKISKSFGLILFIPWIFVSCDYVDEVASESRKSMHYEKVSLQLAKENRELESEVSKLRYEIQSLKAKNKYLSIKLEEKAVKKQKRAIASLKTEIPGNDLVKFSVYRWKADQLLAIAQSEFKKKNYEKSAQFFHAFGKHYPAHKRRDDLFLFQAGVSAYESKKHPNWTNQYLSELVRKFPTSGYYREAKLWLGLSYLRENKSAKFFEIVEEFRKKYRNTDEWKILSSHYEEIVQKYKQ